MIGGVIVLGDTKARVLVRALGPSLQGFGLYALADPMLELHDRNGALLASNDNWRETQQIEIEALAGANERSGVGYCGGITPNRLHGNRSRKKQRNRGRLGRAISP